MLVPKSQALALLAHSTTAPSKPCASGVRLASFKLLKVGRHVKIALPGIIARVEQQRRYRVRLAHIWIHRLM